ncbi:uncharacterized protein [Mytilus edulis]|uniref:uncharacterized protein n=1 Tax=Mytilus edulis TaxID=6550 RepID=UPI0039F1334F
MMKNFKKFGNIIISDIFVFFVVAFWYTTWNIQDKYLFPNHHGLSNGISLSIGIIGISIIAISQFAINKKLRNTNCVIFFLISRCIAFFWAVCGVCHWRGLWNFLDRYTAALSPKVLLVIGLVVLCVLRSIRNILAPPFVLGFDGYRDQFFNQSMIFSQIVRNKIPFELDVLLCTSILGSLVIMFWRDAWQTMDNHLFPDDKQKTFIWSILIFFSVQILAEILQFCFRRTSPQIEKSPYIMKLIIHDAYFIFLGVGNVACWRFIWTIIDKITAFIGPDIGLGSVCFTGFIFLVSAFSSTSIVSKGFIMDASVEQWYRLPTEYIGSYRTWLQDKEKKPEKKDFEPSIETITHL